MASPLAQRLRDPVLWTDATQLCKTVLATVVAWVVAVHVLHIEQAFLAPWAALLTVHATVFGTVKRGAQQIGASVLGVLLAFAAGAVLGHGALALGAVVLAGLLAGSMRGLRAETTTAAATALVVLATGASDDGGMLFSRLLDTGVGIVTGLLVNLLVWPPLRDRAAAGRIDIIDDRIGELLHAMAEALRAPGRTTDAAAWIARTEAIDDEVDGAWQVLGQARESGRLNPRRATRARMRAADDFQAVLDRLGQAVAEVRSMAQTLRLADIPPDRWPRGFARPWLRLLERTADGVARADGAALRGVRTDLDVFARSLDRDDLPSGFWAVGGALIVNLRNVLEALDVVAEAQPVAVPGRMARARRAAPEQVPAHHGAR